MASGSTITSAAYVTKKLYLSGDLPTEMAMRDHPYFSMINKRSNYFGEDANYSWKYGNPQSISGSFANAQTQSETSASSPKGLKLSMSPVVRYGIITIGGVDILRTRTNNAAFVRLFRHTAEGVMEEMGDDLAFQLPRDGTGARGQRATESADVTTLVNADDARNFKVGMTIIASDNADGSSPHSGSAVILSVNLDEGKIGFDTSDISSIGDNDYLFRQGDPDNVLDGREALNPLVAPSDSEDFRGVDRSVYPELNAGARLDNTAATIEENLGRVAVKISQSGAKAECAFLNPINVWAIARRRDAKVEYEDAGGTAKYGFEYIRISTPGGVLKVYSDPDWPTNRGHVVKMRDALLAHADPVVHVISEDGRPVLRQASDDGIEQRIRTVAQQYNLEPRAHGVCSI
jgi:hypothetical protein